MARLKPGDQAPDFATIDEQGHPVSLADFRGKRVILYFYPRDNTPGCTAQACGFRDASGRLEEGNAVVLGVSPDSAESHRKFKQNYDLDFPLLIDSDHAIAEAYGAWGEKKMYGITRVGLIRSHFVIDEKGLILDAKYNVRAKSSPESALTAMRSLGDDGHATG